MIPISRVHRGGIVRSLPHQEFYTPPPSVMHRPPLKGYCQGWGGWGCITFGPSIGPTILSPTFASETTISGSFPGLQHVLDILPSFAGSWWPGRVQRFCPVSLAIRRLWIIVSCQATLRMYLERIQENHFVYDTFAIHLGQPHHQWKSWRRGRWVAPIDAPHPPPLSTCKRK